jgi:phosphoglucomutase
VWTTDKDGPIMGLLAAEITARTGHDPNRFYESVTKDLGPSFYERIDAPATPEQKTHLAALDPNELDATDLAGEPITAKLTKAPGNLQPIGGIKIVAASGWFAARPSGTEDVYKIYAESFRSEAHLRRIQADAHAIVAKHSTT